MPETPLRVGPTPLRVATHFAIPAEQAELFQGQLQEVVDLLAVMPGCEGVELGRSPDDPSRWLLVSRWESVGAYRRAISSYEIKLRQPVLSRATDEPSVYEVLYASQGGVATAAASARASDADTVDLGGR